MATGYRAILRLAENEDAIDVAESQLHGWFLEKKIRAGSGLTTADWDGPGLHRLGRGSELSVVHAAEAMDSSRRRLYRYRERNQHGVWTVSVYAVSAPQSRRHTQSLVIEAGLENSTTADAVTQVATPRLARRILETTNARDADTPLYGVPRTVRAIDIDEVMDAILDPARTAGVVVAPSPDRSHHEPWHQIITSLTKQSVGVATSFVLDPDATELLSSRLPRSHAVDPGVVRTFAPQVDFESVEDGLRHRMLGPATLARAISGTRVAASLVNRHAESTRLRFIQLDLPPDVRRSLEILARAELASERSVEVRRRISLPAPDLVTDEAAEAAPTESAAATSDAGERKLLARIRKLVRKWADRKDATEEAIDAIEDLLTTTTTELKVATEQIDEAVAGIEAMDTELRGLRANAEDLSYDLAVSDDQVRKLDREVQILRRRLIDADLAAQTHVEAIDSIWDPPEDIAELVARITPGEQAHVAATRVIFTGDVDKALEIDVREKTPRYAFAFWDYVHVLFDFAEGRAEGRITSGVHAHLKSDTTDGHKCPPDRHAATESDSVLNRADWRAERVLPVPRDVSDDEAVLMDAHFKPTWRDSFAPRMHYYDDTARSGKIYIGYIGRHLKNTKS